MERQLPRVDIKGTAFYLDVVREELRQMDKVENAIPFNVFELNGNGYTFLYDTLLKCAVEDKNIFMENDGRYEWISLPALMELDPIGIAVKYGIPLQDLCPDVKPDDPEADFEEEGEDDLLY